MRYTIVCLLLSHFPQFSLSTSSIHFLPLFILHYHFLTPTVFIFSSTTFSLYFLTLLSRHLIWLNSFTFSSIFTIYVHQLVSLSIFLALLFSIFSKSTFFLQFTVHYTLSFSFHSLPFYPTFSLYISLHFLFHLCSTFINWLPLYFHTLLSLQFYILSLSDLTFSLYLH